jgi:hypothetical protein
MEFAGWAALPHLPSPIFAGESAVSGAFAAGKVVHPACCGRVSGPPRDTETTPNLFSLHLPSCQSTPRRQSLSSATTSSLLLPPLLDRFPPLPSSILTPGPTTTSVLQERVTVEVNSFTVISAFPPTSQLPEAQKASGSQIRAGQILRPRFTNPTVKFSRFATCDNNRQDGQVSLIPDLS